MYICNGDLINSEFLALNSKPTLSPTKSKHTNLQFDEVKLKLQTI